MARFTLHSLSCNAGISPKNVILFCGRRGCASVRTTGKAVCPHASATACPVNSKPDLELVTFEMLPSSKVMSGQKGCFCPDQNHVVAGGSALTPPSVETSSIVKRTRIMQAQRASAREIRPSARTALCAVALPALGRKPRQALKPYGFTGFRANRCQAPARALWQGVGPERGPRIPHAGSGERDPQDGRR